MIVDCGYYVVRDEDRFGMTTYKLCSQNGDVDVYVNPYAGVVGLTEGQLDRTQLMGLYQILPELLESLDKPKVDGIDSATPRDWDDL